MKALDLFCGLGGWTDGLLAEGWDCVGVDIEEHVYGEHRYPGQFVLSDVCALRGEDFADVDLIVASPPCQEYSYMAMPWSRAKAKAAAIRADETGASLARLNRLFNECFRIQKEASFAAGRHIPMVIENVRGAQPWVGRARYNFGSFYLWGDVPALMPATIKAHKVLGFRFDGSGKSFQSASVAAEGVKQRGSGHAWFDKALDERRKNPDGTKGGGDWFGSGKDCSLQRRFSGSTGRKQPGINLSEIGFNVANAHEFGGMVDGVKIKRSAEDVRQHIGTKRKFASAMIAKIPEPLSRHIGAVFARDWHSSPVDALPVREQEGGGGEVAETSTRLGQTQAEGCADHGVS